MDAHHLVVYNLSLTAGQMPDTNGKTKIEWTLYGTNGTKTFTWWRTLSSGGWDPAVPFHFEYAPTPAVYIGDIVGARIQYGSPPGTYTGGYSTSQFTLTTLSVMSKTCSSCPAKVYTTPPNYKVILKYGPNAPIVKLYPMGEFSRSTSFLNGRKI